MHLWVGEDLIGTSMCQSIQILIILVTFAKASLAGGDQNDKSVHKAILLSVILGCINGFRELVKFIHKNEELFIIIVMYKCKCNSHKNLSP